MRILLIHNYYQLKGGEDVYVDSLYKLLKENGHEVFLYAKHSSDIKNNLISKAKVALRMFYNKSVEKELTKIIKTFKPDIAHFNNIYPLITPVAYKVCKELSIPIVQTIHSYRFMCPKATLFRDGKICEECVGKRFFYPSIKYGCYRSSKLQSAVFSLSAYYHNIEKQINLVNKFIFPAKFTRDYYLKHLPIPAKKTTIIPHFINMSNTRHNNKKQKDYFLYVGRLSEEKGILQLVKLFSKMPSIKLIVIGDGPLREKIMIYTRFKNIILYRFTSRKAIFGFMKNALATIIPSLCYEVGPIVLIESYANATPVIVPDIGVFKERVIDGTTGYFFKFKDFNDLGIKIKSFLDNKKNITNMRTSAFNLYKYKNEYSQIVHLNKLQELYNEVKK